MEPLDPFTFGAEQRCFGCGPHHERGLRLEFFKDGDEVVTRYTPDADHEGPPGILHGGLQTTLADELGAWTIIGLREKWGFTSAIDVRLLRPARTGLEIEGRGRILVERPGVVVTGVIFKQGEKTTLRGRVTFKLVTEEEARRIIGRELDARWLRFAR